METRREFVRKAAMLSGAAGVLAALPDSIQKALAIEPEAGSSVMDAEHIVILMQENRSFDHCYGTLRGVRGFNDPRALMLPSQNPVWLQNSPDGATYAPFRLNIKETKATWMGSLPHSWTNQVDARNHGKHDRWLEAKPSGNKAYAAMPLTLGYYSRDDIPFYYAFADAFTVCDQHFCSSLTGTTPNRLYLWTGTIRESPDAPANVRNEEVDYGREAKWTTFPERLEDAGISWRIYQNELSLESGLQGEEDAWLSNFTDNPIEWFTQYQVRFSKSHRAFLEKKVAALREQLATAGEADKKTISAALLAAEEEQARWSQENFDKLSAREKNLHEKAFCTNGNDPDHRKLESLSYKDAQSERTMQVPKGDVLHQFRGDVKSGKLPTVSWLVAPENFSDHPGAAWYGAWYVAEVLDILTHNPEVWKKTVFILTYDENDGYFDHVPPFVPPHPGQRESGMVSAGIDTAVEHVDLKQDTLHKPAAQARESPIGLGYRVPLVIASPWSRGGKVCSEVFDHTSVLQFMEGWLTHKTGKPIKETNITAWRRAICGDLMSAFSPGDEKATPLPAIPTRDSVLIGIHKARFKGLPTDFRAWTSDEINEARTAPEKSSRLPRQEKGVKRACALPYQLEASGQLQKETGEFKLRLAARNELFGAKAAGAPFLVYAYDKSGAVTMRAYAAAAGESLSDSWALRSFTDRVYRLKVYGPNGFFREFAGGADDPMLGVECVCHKARANQKALSGDIVVELTNRDPGRSQTIEIADLAYGAGVRKQTLKPGGKASVRLPSAKSGGWYDVRVSVSGSSAFEKRFAGRVETGASSVSDPVMGQAVAARK